MTFNILTFGVRGVDADPLWNGNQQLNGNVGPNQLTAANLILANGVPFQQLLLFVGEANNGDLNINVGETAFNLSDMAPNRPGTYTTSGTRQPARAAQAATVTTAVVTPAARAAGEQVAPRRNCEGTRTCR